MRILTTGEMRLADEETFRVLGVPPRAVMECAGRSVADFLCEHYPAECARSVVVACGSGNNGGDGYVVARILKNRGFSVEVVGAVPLETLRGAAAECARSWTAAGGAIRPFAGAGATASAAVFCSAGVAVDAIFGTGFHGAAEGEIGGLISAMNSSSVPVVAIDISSGVEGDTGAVASEAIRARSTVALQFLKPGHLLSPGSSFAGDLFLADIGVWTEAPSLQGAGMRTLLTAAAVRSRLESHFVLPSEAHKGDRGHVLVIGGSAGHYGAPMLAGEAALRSGAGLVTVALPHSAAKRVGPLARELMTCALADDGEGNVGEGAIDSLQPILSLPAFQRGRGAIVLGPGLGRGKGAELLIRRLLEYRTAVPLLLDADALNVLAENTKLLTALPKGAVLTPHPGEMARLAAMTTEEVQKSRWGCASSFSVQHGVWIVLKGALTAVAGPTGELFINPAATAVLGTAGSGDVLAGVIGALLTRGAPIADAVACGVYLHGVAGENLDAEIGIGATAGEIARAVPQAIRRVLCNESGLSSGSRLERVCSAVK